LEIAAILEIEGEERRLDAVAKVLRRRASEIDVAELLAFARVPAAVIPRTDDEEVLVVFVELLQPLVDLYRAVEVFLVPPPGDVERRHRHLGERRDQRLLLPELVVVRMRDVVVPGGNLSVQVLRVRV